MITEPHTFYSDGLRLRGAFFLPDDLDPGAPRPVVIPCSGFTGLMRIHPARFARYLTQRGHLCFGFDYRGFADSEGTPGRVILEEQVRDIAHAVAYATGDPRIDPQRVVLLGWGMAGGLVLDAARGLEQVVGLIAVNGFYDGRRVQRAHRGEQGLRTFLHELRQERSQRVRTGRAAVADPFHLYPLDPESEAYVDNVLRRTPDYAAEVYSWELADSLLRWRPEAYAPEMHLPLLIAHGDRNRLHPPAEAEALHRAYAGPKTLHWLKNAGHTEFMDDANPTFQALGERIVQWLNEQLG